MEACDRATVSWLGKPRPVVPYAVSTPSTSVPSEVIEPTPSETPSATATTSAIEVAVVKKSESSKPGLPKTGAQGAGMLALAALVGFATVRVIRNR
ncbi:hypothetical protein [Propionimicrobium lymphophilum]|uniref:hypothetical protein n=1 Tax=Propionimicrobium lymphophilum TaxID=33012 RepID=UPI000420F362|nr:hypothetical protein [Propionimicrobium lymphophilum]